MSHTKGIFRYIWIIATPFFVWTLEIIQDKTLKFLFGRNDAWDYSKEAWSMFDDAITLGFFPYWVVLGMLLELIRCEDLATVWLRIIGRIFGVELQMPTLYAEKAKMK